MSWKLRWAGHNRGKVRVYREDGSYFYGDPSKYPPEEPQYTEEQKRELEQLDKRKKELDEESRKLQIEIEKSEAKANEYKEQYKKLVAQEKLRKWRKKNKKKG